MKTFLILSLLALPLNAEIRGAVRGGVFVGADHDAVGTIELDARLGNWSVAPAYDSIRGGYGLREPLVVRGMSLAQMGFALKVLTFQQRRLERTLATRSARGTP